MSSKKTKSGSRTIEKTIEIAAPVAEVWQAITEAEHLQRWFPTDAEVEPGVGGKVRLRWRDKFIWEFRIDVAITEKHLRLVYNHKTDFTALEAPEQPDLLKREDSELAVDYYLEAKGGNTTLRLVHSGFGKGSDWDQEYDGTSRGWGTELSNLKYYVEQKLGAGRQVAWVRVHTALKPEDIWQRLWSKEALGLNGKVATLKKGDRYNLAAKSGNSYSGVVRHINPPLDFNGSITELNGSLLTIWIEPTETGYTVNFWLSGYGFSESQVEEFESRWSDILQPLFSTNSANHQSANKGDISVSKNQPKTRSIEKELEIEAPVEAVWKALTDAEELTNWFPMDAKVDPGVGGSIWMSWRNEYQFHNPIAIWQPNRHLRLVAPDEPGQPEQVTESPTPIAMDFYLESRGNKTVLRLVQSGFSADANWDEWYNATHLGWDFQLWGLKHYLENHPDKRRGLIYVRHILKDLTREQAWEILMGLNGAFEAGQPQSLRSGEPYELNTAFGESMAGKVRNFLPPKDFTATITNLNDAVVRLQLEDLQGVRDVTVTINSYGLPGARVEELAQNWKACFERIFGDR